MSVERVWFLGLLGLVGCGPLAGGDYYGEVLFEIEGSVQADFDFPYDGDVGVALLWSNEVELSAQAVLVETRFPARYSLKIFRPPAADSTVRIVGEEFFEASVGQILLFEDDDSNGVWDPEVESLIGGAFEAAVLFVPDDSLPYADTADSAAPPPPDPFEPMAEPPPLWTPTGGFHLVEVAPGPFCQYEWERWMQPLDETRATLYVGYYEGLGADWDCDGSGDFFDQGLTPPEADDPDWNFEDQCPPFEVLVGNCEYLRDFLASSTNSDDFAQDPAAPWAEGWLLELDDCYLEVCPELIEELSNAVNEP